MSATDEQINELKHLIWLLPCADDRAKKIFFALINESEKLKKPVCFYSEETYEIYVSVQNIIEYAVVNSFLEKIGVNLVFRYCYGGRKEMHGDAVYLASKFSRNITTEINKVVVDNIKLEDHFSEVV